MNKYGMSKLATRLRVAFAVMRGHSVMHRMQYDHIAGFRGQPGRDTWMVENVIDYSKHEESCNLCETSGFYTYDDLSLIHI